MFTLFRTFVFGFTLLFSGMLFAAEGTIRVTGSSSVYTVPDMATITIGVTTEARTAREALTQNNRLSASVHKQVKENGIKDRDFQTSNLNLSPVWANRNTSGQKRKITGYVAHNQITIRVRELDRLGAILDQLVQSGATDFRSLQFGIQEPKPYEDEALKSAVKDARDQAELLAAAAGVSLGDILELSKSSAARPMRVEMQAMSMDAPVPIAQGEIGINAQVSMTFEIVQD